MIANAKYNELAYTEMIYQHGFQSLYYTYELKLLVLYMRDYLNFTFDECKKNIIEFCEKKYPDYTYARCYRIIQKALRAYGNLHEGLISIENVVIYENEYNDILRFGLGDKETFLLFSMLVRKKLSRKIYEIKNGKSNNSIYLQLTNQVLKDLKCMSGCSSKKEILTLMRHLNTVGAVKMEDNALLKLLFISQDNECTPLFCIQHYEDTWLYVRQFWGDKKISSCEFCGEPYIISSNRQKYCGRHRPQFIAQDNMCK